MRLYEFTKPSHYLLPAAHTANVLKKGKTIRGTDTTDIADPHLKKKSETKKPTHTL